MKLLVLSRRMIKQGFDFLGPDGQLVAPPPHVIISITDPDRPDAEFQPAASCLGVLRLKFWDIVDPTPEQIAQNARLFGPDDAKQVWDFVNSHLDKIELIVCQCEAGKSRSVGTAAALSKILNGDDMEYFQRWKPNRRVHKALIDEAMQNPPEKDLQAAD